LSSHDGAPVAKTVEAPRLPKMKSGPREYYASYVFNGRRPKSHVLRRPGYRQHRPEGKSFGSNDIARIRVHALRHAQSMWVRYRECLSASLNHTDVNLFVYSLFNPPKVSLL
jgi:hypothetical protein